MNETVAKRNRVFKAGLFSKAAKKAGITDVELCKVIAQVMRGQADDLGGGVFKKRLNRNMHRGIILTKAGRFWVYQYLFAKKDRANIDDCELEGFRKLARAYEGLSDQQVALLVEDKDFVEICHEDETRIQK